MTQEEKQLLLKDLCARLPYEVKGKLLDLNYTFILKEVSYSRIYPLLVRPLECPLSNDDCSLDIDEFKPYLRPMSSMTEEETLEFVKTTIKTPDGYPMWTTDSYDWLNAHHFDYRGLIPMRLALEAPDGIYK